MTDKYNWVAHARCASQDSDGLFEQGSVQREARNVCADCPVRLNCLSYALDNRENFGVWGALTERERRAMLKAYPRVTNWSEWIWTSEDPLAAGIRKTAFPKVFSLIREGA